MGSLRIYPGMSNMQIIDLGLTNFSDTYELQKEFVRKISQGLCEDALLITEHYPVITIGRSGSKDNIFQTRGIEVLSIDRGGDVTYHGPGQIVAYPIFKLEDEARDIHRFLSYLEDVGCNFLESYGLSPKKRSGLRGIWVGNKKIGSIGIGVKKWTTYHGIAININTDLTPFSFMRPCGIEGAEVTSLKETLSREIDLGDAKEKFIRSFKEIPFLAEAVSKV